MKDSVRKLKTKPPENVSLVWNDHPWLMILIGGLVCILSIMSTISLKLVWEGALDSANTFADIGSAFATITLAALTGIYVVATKNLVAESRESRKHQKKMYKDEKEDNREYVRQALKTELNQIDYMSGLIDDWESEGYIPPSEKIPKNKIPPAEHISTRIFKAHIEDLGRLESEEAVKVLEYYHIVEYMKALIEGIRSENIDSMDAHEALFGLMKKYETMRPQLIEMLSDKRSPETIKTEPVFRGKGGPTIGENDQEEGL